MRKQEILEYLKSKQGYYNDKFGIEFIGIFGSCARNEATKDSDIDILYKIQQGKKLSMFKYLEISSLLEDYFKKKIDLVRDGTLKPKIKNHILRDLSYV